MIELSKYPGYFWDAEHSCLYSTKQGNGLQKIEPITKPKSKTRKFKQKGYELRGQFIELSMFKTFLTDGKSSYFLGGFNKSAEGKKQIGWLVVVKSKTINTFKFIMESLNGIFNLRNKMLS